MTASSRALSDAAAEPLARQPSTAALLGAALTAAAIPTSPAEWGVAARTLVAPRALRLVVVNERAERAVRRVVADGRTFDDPVAVP